MWLTWLSLSLLHTGYKERHCRNFLCVDEFKSYNNCQFDTEQSIMFLKVYHLTNSQTIAMFFLQVILKEVQSGKQVTFPCDKWLSREQGDGEIVCEFAALHEGEEPLPSKYCKEFYDFFMC